jgi:hypothetical protein
MPPASSKLDWPARERYWRWKLRRLRFNAEPLGDQVKKYRRATTVLTIVPAGIGLIFLGIFAAFRRPDVGLILSGVILVPIVAGAWLDYWRLARNVRAYERERSEAGR